jgi:hypothetical protein
LFGVDNGSSRFFTRGLLARRPERRANTVFGFALYDTRRLCSVSSPVTRTNKKTGRLAYPFSCWSDKSQRFCTRILLAKCRNVAYF